MKRTLLLATTLAALLLAALSYRSPLSLQTFDSSSPGLSPWLDQPVMYANHPPSADSLPEPELLHRLRRLYRYQADFAAAQANAHHKRAAHLLDKMTTRLAALLKHAGVADHPRVRTLYHTITAEYETAYGVAPPFEPPSGEIYDVRRDLFAAVNATNGPLLEDVPAAEVRSMNTEVPMTINRQVRASMTYLMRNPERHVYRWLRRSATYFPMIEHIFAEENVPDELKYLALVESGLNPRARSRARAAGLWQFVPSTARMYNLTINPWIDERLDPEKSTRAAAAHLRDLYELFGDWQLALAGYNCNPAVIRRAVRQARDRLDRRPTFWDIYNDIPRETRNYVPTFIAATLIVSNPTAFDLKRVEPGPRYAFDYVPVEGMLDLQTVADLANTSLPTLQALNPELRRAQLPPSDEPYYVRLPYGSYETFMDGYAQLPDDAKQQTVEHVVQRGETVSLIAQRYDVSRRALMQSNDLQLPAIDTGQRLSIPAPSYQGNEALVASTNGQPIRVRYGARVTRPVISPELATKDSSPADQAADH